MDKILGGMIVLCLLILLAGCTDTSVAANSALYGDKPAAITCYTYGVKSFDGFSTGKVEYDEGGRVSFVDQASGRYTVIEGDCRITYAR